jgi:hypothetical protein
MLISRFDRAAGECDIDIVFRHGPDGEQQNDCRDAILKYAQHPSTPLGRSIATRLQVSTTRRSGLGLLFTMVGSFNGKHQIVISRFPADQGIVAEKRKSGLSVEFIERVFLKNAKAYKSVQYASTSFTAGIRTAALDRQRLYRRPGPVHWWVIPRPPHREGDVEA